MKNFQEIGYVVKMFPRLSETFIRNEIMELERQGLALRIFSLKRPSVAEMRLAGTATRAPIIYLPDHIYREPWRVLRAQLRVMRRYPDGYWRTLRHVLAGRELLSFARGVRRFCQTCCLVDEMGEIRHLHAHFASDPTRLASWARMICECTFSVTTHAKDLYQDNRLGSPGLRYKLSKARFVVTNSDYSAEGLRAAFNGGRPPRILTIYNSINLAAFPERESEPREPLVLSAGRLIEKKGFEDLLKACDMLRDRRVEFRCEIVGSGPLAEKLSREIAKQRLEKEVKLRGQMSQAELHDRYIQALVFALPCRVAANGDRDILPNVIKEAMAVGVPVITTRLGGIEELVTHEHTGLLVAPGDVEALAGAIERLLADSALRRRLAKNARAAIEEKFDLQTNFTVLKRLLCENLDEGSRTETPNSKVLTT